MNKIFGLGGLAVALLLFLVVNILTGAAFRSARLDLTENQLYTLSDGTRNILGRLDEPIRLRFFFSKQLAQKVGAGPLSAYAQRVQEMLEEYAAASNGKVALEVHDPEPFSEAEDKAVSFGIKGSPATTAGEMFYFGLAGTNTTDQEEVIPFFQQNREEFLEYDLTRLVVNLSTAERKVVGLLTSLNMEGNPLARFTNPEASADAWFVVEEMRKLFEVRVIPKESETIEEGLDVLMIVHPQGLSAQTLYAIDQYVMGGGKAIVFVDPHCEVQEVRQDPQNPMAAMMANRSSDLGPLLGAWGLDLAPDSLAGDLENALRVNYQGQAVDYVVWTALRGGEQGLLNADDPVTADIDVINLASAGVLTRRADATTTITPLLQTSSQSMRVPKTDVQFGADPVRVLNSFVPANERLLVAARVSGPAKTAYPDGAPKAEAAEGETPPAPKEQIKESQGPINVIVVADADLLEDRFWTRTQNFLGQRIVIPTAGNADLAINAVDNMSGTADLISLRSRGRSVRPFDRVAEIRKAAESSLRARAKMLEDKLRDTEQKINELQSGKEGESALILSDEQRAEIERFREEQIKTREELRKVRYDMNKDIESLGTKLKVANILLVPGIVVLAAIGAASIRKRRGARASGSDS